MLGGLRSRPRPPSDTHTPALLTFTRSTIAPVWSSVFMLGSPYLCSPAARCRASAPNHRKHPPPGSSQSHGAQWNVKAPRNHRSWEETREGGSPCSSSPDDFTPRSITPSLVLSGLLWKDALGITEPRLRALSHLYNVQNQEVTLTSPFQCRWFLQDRRRQRWSSTFTAELVCQVMLRYLCGRGPSWIWIWGRWQRQLESGGRAARSTRAACLRGKRALSQKK